MTNKALQQTVQHFTPDKKKEKLMVRGISRNCLAAKTGNGLLSYTQLFAFLLRELLKKLRHQGAQCILLYTKLTMHLQHKLTSVIQSNNETCHSPKN